MNREKIFHEITTGCRLNSVPSILKATLTRILRHLNGERAAWFSVGGNQSVLAAQDIKGAYIQRAGDLFPSAMILRTAAEKAPVTVDMSTTHTSPGSTGMSSISRFLAVPVLLDTDCRGVLCLQRPYPQGPYANHEKTLLLDLSADVMLLLRNSSEFERQRNEMDKMKTGIEMGKQRIISDHPSMYRLIKLIKKLARVPATVLIHGESGTGKELVARAIYDMGDHEGPFVAINCGGLEPNLLKSELFGYLKGSFTGAAKDRPGLFKKAEGGVLFLDEIGEMPTDMQVALLRTLETGEILPVGADMPFRVKTRVVAATHRDLREMVAENKFRNDLYQRLKGITLQVPPLRARRGDVPLLCDHFIRKYNDKFGLNFKGLRPEAQDFLEEQPFAQGNVRELEHLIERAMVFEDDDELIGIQHLQLDNDHPAGSATPIAKMGLGEGSFEDQMSRFAANLLNETIRACNGNKTKAMKTLGLSRSTFYGMINRYDVDLQGALK